MPSLALPRGDRTVVTIGRAIACDLVLDDATVSRRHAELRLVGSTWVLVDLDSTNGTRANGWRVRSGVAVRPGDIVAFGRATFRLVDG
jgi:pSer/pThr/pTyr-binding forkhead associated (FHA) protein